MDGGAAGPYHYDYIATGPTGFTDVVTANASDARHVILHAHFTRCCSLLAALGIKRSVTVQ